MCNRTHQPRDVSEVFADLVEISGGEASERAIERRSMIFGERSREPLEPAQRMLIEEARKVREALSFASEAR